MSWMEKYPGCTNGAVLCIKKETENAMVYSSKLIRAVQQGQLFSIHISVLVLGQQIL